jgi:tRNA dimethylallyltransferase
MPITAAHRTTALPRPLVIVGPTGVGKTRVALALAHELGGELIGADSVQVYRGFDIGSAKPTREELGGIAHHLIDVADATQPLDAAYYATLADAAIRDVTTRGRVPIVVGGTGLWLRALLRGLLGAPAVDPVLRAELERSWERAGALAMHTRLAQVDPKSAQSIHMNDKLRVVRALEVYEQTGRPLGELRAEHARGAPRYDDLTIVVDNPQPHYAELIRARTRGMFARGLEAEVRDLIDRYGAHVRPLQSLGYRQVVEALQSPEREREDEATIDAIARATCVYARRQRTWWKSDPNVKLRLTSSQALEVAQRARFAAHAHRTGG